MDIGGLERHWMMEEDDIEPFHRLTHQNGWFVE